MRTRIRSSGSGGAEDENRRLMDQAAQDYESVSRYFHSAVERTRQESRLTEERIAQAYQECSAGIREAGREDLLSTLEEIYLSYLARFRELHVKTQAEIQDVVGAYTAARVEPPPVPPARPEDEPGEPEEDFQSMIKEVDRRMESLVSQIDGLEHRMNLDRTLKPASRESLGRIHASTIELIRIARANKDSAQQAFSRGAPAERVRIAVETFRQTAEVVAAHVQSFAALLENIQQIGRTEEHVQRQELVARMDSQHERVAALRLRRERIQEKIQDRSDGLRALVENSRGVEKIQASFLLGVGEQFTHTFDRLTQLDRDVSGMTLPQDLDALRGNRAQYDEILTTIERDLTRAEEIFENLPGVIILSRSEPRVPEQRLSTPSRPSPPKPRRPQYEYEKRPPRGRRLDYRTGEPLPDTPLQKLWKGIISWFGRR